MTNVSAIERRSARSLDVGETFDRVDHPAGHGLWSTWDVTEHEPPRLLGCRRIAGGPPVVIRQVLESIDGSTRLTVCSEGEVSGPLAGGPEVKQAIARQLEHDLGGLKELLERTGMSVGRRPVARALRCPVNDSTSG